MPDTMELKKKIAKLKKERNAVILAHNYERGDIQDIADFLGDSLELSQKAVDLDVDVIVFCGVHFMAESAAVLSPDKTVLLPELYARCPMADMARVDSLRSLKQEHPDAAVVCYVNTTAEVKAECDICCTSANAIEVVKSLEQTKIIFVPDKNLADYVARNTDKQIIPWAGCCPTHNQILPVDVQRAKSLHPMAEVLAHPECRREVLDMSDGILSTNGMVNYVSTSESDEFIIVTESGLLHRLNKENPYKKFYEVSTYTVCPDMKMIDIKAVADSLENMKYVITVPEDIRIKAKRSLDRMLAIKRKI
ncbi:quinolinate synthase NadA [Methanomethylovorans sp.]|uniref:quinolinate synthase NadA n=1 Tax=Methanomethylovorans sp. TaxID=2758717 RepID=UPI00345EF23B